MELLVLTQNNCKYCEILKNYLESEDVEFTTVNMSVQPHMAEKYAVMGVPTVVLLDEDKEVVAQTTGFNPSNTTEIDLFIEQL